MKEMSILFDSIMYGILSFNEDDYLKTDFSLLIEREKFYIFHKYKSTYKINELLSPFYIYDTQRASILTAYFMEKVVSNNIYKYDMNSFIADILDRQSFYHHFLSFFLKSDSDSDDELEDKYKDYIAVVNRLNELDYAPDISYKFLIIYGNFDSAVNNLVQSLKDIYKIARQAHQENKDVINNLYYECKNDDTINLLVSLSLSRVEKESYDKRPAVYTLFGAYTCYGMDIFDILGLEFKNILVNWNKYGNITKKSFGKILYHEYLSKIFDIMMDTDEINAVEVSKKLLISQGSAGKYLKEMLYEKTIVIKRKTSISTYYALDDEYFRQAIIMLIKEYLKMKKKRGERDSKSYVQNLDKTSYQNN
jgi:DNA-binding transcriptional ArsR family regulator